MGWFRMAVRRLHGGGEMTDAIAIWRERREWLADHEYDVELKSAAQELSAVGVLLKEAKNLDKYVIGGLAGMLDVLADKLSDLAHGRTPAEALPE